MHLPRPKTRMTTALPRGVTSRRTQFPGPGAETTSAARRQVARGTRCDARAPPRSRVRRRDDSCGAGSVALDPVRSRARPACCGGCSRPGALTRGAGHPHSHERIHEGATALARFPLTRLMLDTRPANHPAANDLGDLRPPASRVRVRIRTDNVHGLLPCRDGTPLSAPSSTPHAYRLRMNDRDQQDDRGIT